MAIEPEHADAAPGQVIRRGTARGSQSGNDDVVGHEGKLASSAEDSVIKAIHASHAQRGAIEAAPGPVLVLAGPGAGKTYCLIERVRFLIEALGADPTRICAVTYTNKAAEEIVTRLNREIGSQAEGMTRGTLHALCLGLLREHGELVGLRRGFGVADEEYQRIVLRRHRVASKRVSPLLTLFGRGRLQGFRLTAGDQDHLDRYAATLRARNMVDFDDLVVFTRDLLTRHPAIARTVAARWDHLLVDEFQDLSPAQYEVIRVLGSGHRSVFAVGDEEQSIFSWTGADPEVLRRFQKDFGVPEPVVLERNRRSARAIFAAARQLVEHNPQLFDKRLEAVRESPYPVMIRMFPDERAEADWLLADLRADRAEFPGSWGEYAILYRKHEVGDLLERRLVEAGIPCRLARGRALLDDEVIGQVVASLRIIQTPEDPVVIDALAQRLLPRDLLERIHAAGDSTLLNAVRRFAQRGHRDDPDTKKAWRFVFQVENLFGIGRRHTTLAGVVDELLEQRFGPYRSPLEDRSDEITDPAAYPGAAELAADIERVAARDGRLWVAPHHGLEIALRGMLVRTAVVRAVGYLSANTVVQSGDVVLRPDATAPAELGVRLFKALQLVHAKDFPDLPRTFVAFDLETSDFDRSACEIIEIGAARVVDGEIVDTFHSLVRSSRRVSEAATKVHQYTDADLIGQPSFAAVWPRFRDFVGDHLLVAHNAQGFDMPVLRREAGQLGAAVDGLRCFDTLPLARALFAESARLGDLAHRFGVPPGHAHHATDDAVTLARVLKHMSAYKLGRSRKSALVNLLDLVGLALALGDDPEPAPERQLLRELSRPYVLGRYSDVLEYYAAERERTGALQAPTVDELLDGQDWRKARERYRAGRKPAERYPAAVARLSGLVAASSAGSLEQSIARLLEHVALSTSEGVEADPERVNLFTLHSTKGLEFSRVYVVGVEDYQLPGYYAAVENRRHEIEEARRLLYVGMTRAMDRLVLTRAASRFGKAAGGSLFLEEMGLATPVAVE